LKVLVVGTGGSIVSGISSAADEMARTLPALGHTAERLHAGERMRRRGGAFNLENVWAVVADAASVARRARRGKADVVWIHTFGVPALPALRALAMVAAARLAGRPAVVHLHAYDLEGFVARGGLPLRAVLRALMWLADALVVLYDGAGTALSRGRVHVLPNWVDVPGEAAPLPPQPPLRVVFVGGLVRRKGAPQLVEAMRALQGDAVELRLVGGAGEDGPEALAGLTAAAGDLRHVTFAGELGPAGVRAELRAAHLLVLASAAEGTPISMLEAMAEGRAVLVGDAGNMKALVEETGCGWVLPDREPSTIAEHLRRIAGDPAALAEAAARARQAAAERFSPEAGGARIERVLGSIRPSRWSIPTG
jgi:glycosyltransferase involved in cell wall biosynthesis